MTQCYEACQNNLNCLSFSFNPSTYFCYTYSAPVAFSRDPGTEGDCPGDYGLFYDKACPLSPGPSCQPRAGCGSNENSLGDYEATTLTQCSDFCNADPNCLSQQFIAQASICYTYSAPVSVVLTPGDCQGSFLYDRYCS
ncbi:hypothetical protein LY76DRAFT_52395 [Colletotrichum caudatum]|nr:hypothetical protein LY76DRAFT_52395 [Colletotrichum caudatum]